MSRTTSSATPTESESSASASGSAPSPRATLRSVTCPPIGCSRRDLRERSMSRQTRNTTVVTQPSRFSTVAALVRLRRSHASCTVSSASLKGAELSLDSAPGRSITDRTLRAAPPDPSPRSGQGGLHVGETAQRRPGEEGSHQLARPRGADPAGGDGPCPRELSHVPQHERLGFRLDDEVLVAAGMPHANLGLAALDQQPESAVPALIGELESDDLAPARQAAAYSPTLWPNTISGSTPQEPHICANEYSSAKSAGCVNLV